MPQFGRLLERHGWPCSYSPNYLGSTSLSLPEFKDAIIQIYDAEIGVVDVDVDVVVIVIVSVDGKLPEQRA